MSAWAWTGVAGLGALGAIARFLLDSLVEAKARATFPLGTLLVNATGSLLLGLLTGLAASGELLVLAGAAALGSYTTFSTWMLETHRLSEDADIAGAIVNVLVTLAVGVAAAALGRVVGAQI